MADIINLNKALKDELTTLPGVGPAMAERIIAARPFEAIADLQKVSGVGPAMVERLTPLVSITDTRALQEDSDVIYLGEEIDFQPEIPEEGIRETGVPMEEALAEVVEIESKSEEIIPKDKAIIPIQAEKPKKGKPAKTPRPITWGQVLLMSAACSLVAFILAVLLSLGIMGSINNGLRYASVDQARVLDRQAEALDSQIGILLDDIASLRSRIDNLESMSSRISELEAVTEQLNADLTITADIVDGLNAQIEEVTSSAMRFQVFLDGLADLLDNLVEPEEVP